MKTERKVLASFLGAAIWADGEFDEFEKGFITEIAEELNLPTLVSEVEEEITKNEKLSEDDISKSLLESSKLAHESEKELILDLCLQAMCADAELAIEEVDNFFAFADILGIDEDKAEKIMDDFVEETEDLIIEQEEEE